MNPIDQLADERDKLKAKLSQAKAKLRPAKSLAFALAVERDRALQTVDRANAANIRARAMICDAAGIPHDADILAWIAATRVRIVRLEEAVEAYQKAYTPDGHTKPHDCFSTGPRTGDPIQDFIVCPGCWAQQKAKEAKP